MTSQVHVRRFTVPLSAGMIAISAAFNVHSQPPLPPAPDRAAPAAQAAVAPATPADRDALSRLGRAPRPVPAPGAQAGGPLPPADEAPTEGRVASYLLSPEAGVAGVLLDNGREIRVPPHLGTQLAALVKPGDVVRFSGRMAPVPGATAPVAGTPAAPMPAPWTLTAVSSGSTLSDTPPAAREPAPLPPQGQSALQPMKVTGTVKRVLTGPQGEANGVVLDNGTQIAVPPQVPDAADHLMTVGTRLSVEGYGRTSSFGTAMQATSLAKPGEAPVTIYAPAPPVNPVR